MNNNYTITKDNLTAIGINLTDEKMQSLLKHLNDELEERVGSALIEEMNEEQIDQYNELSKTANDEQIGEWLNDQIPEFNQIIQDEINIMLGDIAEKADALDEA